MAHVVVIGAGIGGLPTAYELRHLLPCQHRITLIANTPNFTFIPSLPWVALGLTSLAQIQLDIGKLVTHRGIEWVMGSVTQMNPHQQQITVGEKAIAYDYAVIATGPELALDAVPGLGPETGYTQSVCKPNHAVMAQDAWLKFLDHRGPLVVGAVPGVSCMGPAYEFALLADYVLRRRRLRQQVPITLVTPEPYAGHLGIGGMANSARLVTQLLAERDIELIENVAVTQIQPQSMQLSGDRILPFAYSMLLSPFRGAQFLRDVPGLTDAQGFLPVLPTYQHPRFPSIYSIGIAVQLKPPAVTPIPLGVPKTGQMTEAMGMAVAHNIAIELGAISAQPVTPTLDAICLSDFGDTGIAFIANPVLPDPVTGTRKRAIALRGRWVSWIKAAFEKFFLAKMRWGLAVPWFERLGLRLLGLSLVKPIESDWNITHEYELKQ
ncbi:MAG TPA: FAD-dependent oxidoreductase [Allocoleopsis sp.]